MSVKTEDCIEHYLTKAKLAEALGIEPPSVYSWGDFPPPLRQLQIESITGGALKAESDCDKFRVSITTESREQSPASAAQA